MSGTTGSDININAAKSNELAKGNNARRLNEQATSKESKIRLLVRDMEGLLWCWGRGWEEVGKGKQAAGQSVASFY